MRIILVCFIAFIVLTHATAQKPDEWQAMQEKYNGEPAVFMNRAETVSILVKGDSLSISADVFEDILYLKDPPEMFASRRVHGSHFTEVEGIKAKTLVWDKSRHKELSISNFAKKFDTDDGIFYDDSYYYAVSFPSVAPRNRTQLQYRNNYRDARFLPGYIFATYIPQEKAVYTIKTTADVELFHEVRNDSKGDISFRKYTKGKEVFYEWSVREMKPTKIESGAPSVRYYAPHVICYVKSYRTATGTTRVLSDLDDLYRWYSTFTKGLDEGEPSEDLKQVVAGLRQPGDDEIDVVRKIFYWVQDNIRYIAFEDGMRGFIPHNGSYVCEKRYGDCKDMASIIVNMLDVAGIKSYHTWIGTRDIPYSYSSLPTPLVDNHMIATYISPDNQYYFLDATSNHTPFGYPSSMIQGKEALIGKGSTYEVVKVPVLARELNQMTDSVFIDVSGNELKGRGITSLVGYPKVMAGYQLDRVQQDVVKKYVTRLVGRGSNKFYLDQFDIKNLDDRDRPTRIDYTFRIGDYFQQIGNEIYLNLHLNKDHYNDYINLKSRETPIENEYQYVKREIVVFQLPEGYAVDYLPGDINHPGKEMGLEVHYKKANGKIIMEKTFYVDYLLLNPASFESWNESVRKVSEAYKEAIILKKI